jgi:hypothetical protein
VNPITHDRSKTTLTICTCGTLHLTHGSVTLRFKPDEFLAFGNNVASLVAQFREVLRVQQPAALSPAQRNLCH